MKIFVVIACFFLLHCIQTVDAKCYHYKLIYGTHECLKDSDDNEALAKVLEGQTCKELSCSPIIPSLKANVCIIKESNSFNLWIYRNSTNSMYRFDTFNTKKYNITKIAIRDFWMTLLLEYESTEAYRLSFILTNLSKIKSNSGNPEYMGKLKNIVWEPSFQDDKYMILNSTEVQRRLWCSPGAKCSPNFNDYIDSHRDLCVDVNAAPSTTIESYLLKDIKEKYSEAQILLLVALITIGVLILALFVAIVLIAYILKRKPRRPVKSDITRKEEGRLLEQPQPENGLANLQRDILPAAQENVPHNPIISSPIVVQDIPQQIQQNVPPPINLNNPNPIEDILQQNPPNGPIPRHLPPIQEEAPESSV